MLEADLQYLALAISAKRTRVHFGQRHYCVKHEKIVDKNHIDECDLLKGKYPTTEFNQELFVTSIKAFTQERFEKMKEHHTFLRDRRKLWKNR